MFRISWKERSVQNSRVLKSVRIVQLIVVCFCMIMYGEKNIISKITTCPILRTVEKNVFVLGWIKNIDSEGKYKLLEVVTSEIVYVVSSSCK